MECRIWAPLVQGRSEFSELPFVATRIGQSWPLFRTESYKYPHTRTLFLLPVRNVAAGALRKRYYGGGTLVASDNATGFHDYPSDLAEKFEDGTVSFLRCVADSIATVLFQYLISLALLHYACLCGLRKLE